MLTQVCHSEVQSPNNSHMLASCDSLGDSLPQSTSLGYGVSRKKNYKFQNISLPNVPTFVKRGKNQYSST